MNVPKLRFKEFNDEWKDKKLKDIVIFSKGNILSKNDLDDNGKFPCILYGQLYTKYKEVIREIFSKTNNDSSNIVKSKIGDVLIPSSGETPIDISTSSCLMLDNILIGGDINILSPKENCNGRFLSYMINNNKKVEIAKVAQGYSIVHLYNDNLRDIIIKMPSLKEQNQVANVLELLDKKIELQSKKIEALKLYKKGLILKIFTEDNLNETTIDKVGTIVTGTTPSKSNSFFWNGGNKVWITPSDINYDRDIFDSQFKLTEEGLKNGRFIPKNSILVTCIASIGKNAILKVDGSCNQQINAIIPNENNNANYIYYLMEFISPYLQSIAGASATSIINKDAFSKINIKVHKKEEQDQIDKILSQYEKIILLNQNKLEKLEDLKKGLMQKMFV